MQGDQDQFRFGATMCIPPNILESYQALWAEAMDKAFLAYFNTTLNPPYDPYEDSLKYLISTYFIPYVA